MITEKAREELEMAYKKIREGIIKTIPSAEEAIKEMATMDKEFNKLRESVRKQIERGARRTANLSVWFYPH